MENDWQNWCRLCAKEDIFLNNVNVFRTAGSDDRQSILDSWTGELSLSATIGKFFWVNISKDDDMPKVICEECFTMLSKLVEFSERIMKVQNMFCLIQSNAVDKTYFNEVRLKCGLLNEDQKNVMPVSPKTVLVEEVYCLDKKHKIVDFVDNLQEEDTAIENPLAPKDFLKIKEEVVADDPVDNCNIDDIDYDDMGSISSIIEQSLNDDKNIEQKKTKKIYHFLYECSECPRKFKRLDHYRHHLKKIHQQNEIDDTPVQCPLCPREFKTKVLMERHKKTHLPMEKRFPCSFCDKRFISNWSLQSHIKNIHTKERPFICEQCGVAVYTAGNLKQHMLTHTDYAPFECDICKRCFKDNNSLRRHQEIHDDNKHICSECGQKLSSRSTLNRHLLVHSDKMKHKCDYCGRQFKRSKALKAHLILHTGLKPYACDFCDRTFANGSNCRKHKKTCHPTELAALEAGGEKAYAPNIPKLDTLKAISKSNNLSPIVSKNSGRFAFGIKPKFLPVNPNAEKICEQVDLKIEKANEVEYSQTSSCVIPTNDSIYQIMNEGTAIIE